MSFTNKLNNWKDTFLQDNVQPVDDAGHFLSSESVVIFSGPPALGDGAAATVGANLIPIGLVQNASVSQGKQIQQMYEIGSRKPIMIPGRTQIQLQLSRVLFDGASLAKAVYVKSVDAVGVPTTESPVTVNSATTSDFIDLESPTDPFTTTTSSGEFWINLASNVFNKPLGLGFALYDMDKDAYGGFYLENCYARNHNFSISAQQTVLAESMSFLCTQLRPLSSTFIGG